MRYHSLSVCTFSKMPKDNARQQNGTTEGRDISRTNLLLHGISYEPNWDKDHDADEHSSSGMLPDHVEAVREGLLSFENIIPNTWKKDLLDEFASCAGQNLRESCTSLPRHSSFIHLKRHEEADGDYSGVWRRANKNPKHDEIVAKKAQKQLEKAEPEWTLFFRRHVFTQSDDEKEEEEKEGNSFR